MMGSSLFEAQEKGETCISVIISFRHRSDIRCACLQVKKVIEKVELLLQGIFPETEIRQLLITIRSLAVINDKAALPEGIGIYLAKGFSQRVDFPFSVKERVHIGESFRLRELVRLDYYAVNYFVLGIGEHTNHLYKGHLNELSEITDKRFPEELTTNWSSSYDQDTLVKGGALHTTDLKLDHYLEDHVLILAGEKEDLADFTEITTHADNIAGCIKGSLDAWSFLRKWLDGHLTEVASALLQRRNLQACCGVREIWRQAQEGKALVLLVEEGYAEPAWLCPADGCLHLKPPRTESKVIPDVVNEIMSIVLQEKGEVVILKDGTLKDYEGMVMLSNR